MPTREDLLHFARGELEIPKCVLYQLAWHFNPDGSTQMSSKNINVTLQYSTSRKTYIITQEQHATPSTYVGISSSPDGNQIHAIKKLKGKCEMYTKIINSNKIQRHHSWTAHNRIFKLYIAYPLGTYYISRKSYNKLQSTFSQSNISSMEMNRNFSTSHRYGNHNYDSLTIHHIET